MTPNDKLFMLLSEKGKKSKDLAEYLDVKPAVISAWKTRGTDPPSNMLVNICKFFDISLNDFFDIKESNAHSFTDDELNIIKYFRKCNEKEKKLLSTLCELDKE
ncbi:MAG: helix-turn-helix domain-containing protein [Lachnospiraceae bacterium]|nr:helix-turn-helix domain-containing protein [Lachnospiraceae bacterium]MDE6232649.1 helix-turn-helix domain-containing protein [Lachnospiraceae bacterium]MDE6254498.1 helix-turn-helix domain-containing protein [Lachnospiraceae bacterium]